MKKIALVLAACLAAIAALLAWTSSRSKSPPVGAGGETASAPIDPVPRDARTDPALTTLVAPPEDPKPASSAKALAEDAAMLARKEDEARWLREVDGLDAEALEAFAQEEIMALARVTQPIFEARIDAPGKYEVIGSGNRRNPGKEWDESKVMFIRVPSDSTSEIRMVVLPEDEYPELYAQQRRNNWLRDRVLLLRQEELAKAKHK